MLSMEEDKVLSEWVYAIVNKEPVKAGSFLQAFAKAVEMADSENYVILRSAIAQLQKKYPKYGANTERS